jgi:hypothetical protein
MRLCAGTSLHLTICPMTFKIYLSPILSCCKIFFASCFIKIFVIVKILYSALIAYHSKLFVSLSLVSKGLLCKANHKWRNRVKPSLHDSFLFVMIATAQNIVPNGSFEEYDACPTGINQVDTCKYWYAFGGIYGVPGSPDYFNACAIPMASIPDNAFGTQAAFEGNAYMGLWTFEYSYWYREYIGAQLFDTMQVGKQYSVSMRVSRGNRTSWQTDATVASNKMSIRLTTSAYQPGSILPVNNFAQLYDDSIIVDSINWVLLHWNFISDSAYTNIYIGNFFDSDHTDTQRVQVIIPPGRAYYFIDSVNIGCIDCSANGVESIDDESQLFYNSFNEAIEIITSRNAKLSVVNEVGEVIYLGEVIAGKSSIPFGYTKGIYLAVIQTNEGRTVKKILVN